MALVAESRKTERIAVLGAGISGLSTAWLLKRRGIDVRLLEASDRVGGLARSFEWHGLKCDIAPHRFFTNDPEILSAFLDLVPMSSHKRNSRIFMAGHVIRDPINPIELVLKLPAATSIRLVWDFLFRPTLPEDSFESMAISSFGRGLYEFFSYPTRASYSVCRRGKSPRNGADRNSDRPASPTRSSGIPRRFSGDSITPTKAAIKPSAMRSASPFEIRLR